MDFSKARALFATKALKHRRLCIQTTEQTTGARQLLALATAPYSRAATVCHTIRLAKYLRPARFHHKYRGR